MHWSMQYDFARLEHSPFLSQPAPNSPSTADKRLASSSVCTVRPAEETSPLRIKNDLAITKDVNNLDSATELLDIALERGKTKTLDRRRSADVAPDVG